MNKISGQPKIVPPLGYYTCVVARAQQCYLLMLHLILGEMSENYSTRRPHIISYRPQQHQCPYRIQVTHLPANTI